MDYRRYYKEYYSIDFGSEYSIHHIDQNRENNDIRNLILLPRKLHSRFHMNLGLDHYRIYDIRFQMFHYEPRFGQDFEEWLETVTEQYNELSYWIKYKWRMDQCLEYTDVTTDKINHPEGIVARQWEKKRQYQRKKIS